MRTKGTGPGASLRVAAACALVLCSIASSFAQHNHSFLLGDNEPSLSSARATHFLTRHDPRSRTSHWHSVIAVVAEHDCIACHNQRLAGIPGQKYDVAPRPAIEIAPLFLSIDVRAASLLPSGSRAPPTLL